MLKVDVILPVYNPNEWVWDAIKSVVSQTYDCWRLLIIDDCSPENKVDEIRDYCLEYGEKVEVLRLDENVGAPNVRMYAVEHSSADIIAFIDQDDLWDPKKLEMQVAYFHEHKDVDLVHTNIEKIDENGCVQVGAADRENEVRDSLDYTSMAPERLASSLCRHNSLRLVAVAVRRDVFRQYGGYDDALRGGEEIELWVRWAARGCRFGCVNETLVARREHGCNTSAVYKSKRTDSLIQAYGIIADQFPFLATLCMKARTRVMQRRFLLALENRDYQLAKSYLRQVKELGGVDLMYAALWSLCGMKALARPIVKLYFWIRCRN